MSLRTFKFLFKAQIGQLTLNTSVQCELSATWKRSNQSSKTALVPLQSGIANINQTLTLPVNMYFDTTSNSFQEKKSQFSFTLHTFKGDKSAGVIIVDLATMLNNKLEVMEDFFRLEKCPDKEAKIWMKISSEALGQGEEVADKVSTVEPKGAATNPLIASSRNLAHSFVGKTTLKEEKPLISVQDKLKKLQAQNEFLKSELKTKQNIRRQNESVEIFKKEIQNLNNQITFLKNEMTRSKTIQSNLEKELNTIKSERHQKQKQLEGLNKHLTEAYEELQEVVYRYI